MIETGIHPMPGVKPKKVDQPEMGLGQYHQRNVKATATGKALIKTGGTALEGDRKER